MHLDPSFLLQQNNLVMEVFVLDALQVFSIRDRI
jgi:hypothetical protein